MSFIVRFCMENLLELPDIVIIPNDCACSCGNWSEGGGEGQGSSK